MQDLEIAVIAAAAAIAGAGLGAGVGAWAQRSVQARTAVNIQWVPRFEAYYAVWIPVYALQTDISLLLRALREKDEVKMTGYRQSSLFWYAMYLLRLREFEDRHGGLWILADATREQIAADAVAHIAIRAPFTQMSNSVLTMGVRALPEHELATFVPWMESERGRPFQDNWSAFLASCSCGSGAADRDCAVHQLILECERFVQALDDDWDSLAYWYRSARPGTHSLAAVVGTSRHDRA